MASNNKNSKITTIKLSLDTKRRIDHLKEYRRETYDEILEKILDILNTCKIDPERANSKLRAIDIKKIKEKRKENISQRQSQTQQLKAVNRQPIRQN